MHFLFQKDEPDAFEELGTGNRIATWLLYVSAAVCVCACACVLLPLTLSSFPLQMTDVQAGGATVFTDIGAAVKPKKVQLLTFFIIIITETSLFNKPN